MGLRKMAKKKSLKDIMTLLEAGRKEITLLQEKQGRIFDLIILNLGLDTDLIPVDLEINRNLEPRVWDFMYNDFGDAKELAKMIREKK